MNIKSVLGILAGITAIGCFVPYLQDIFKKKTTPHSYSWLIWSILQTIGVIAIVLGQGGYYGASGIAVGAIFCLLIFFLSLRYGTKNVTKTDTLLFVASLGAIFIWIFTKNAIYSVILISIIDFAAFIPTIRKGYEEPMTETISTYFIAALSNIFALMALSIYSLTTALYLSTLVFTNSLFVVILLYRRR